MFSLRCLDPICGFDGPEVDLDQGQSIMDLRLMWEAGYVNPHYCAEVGLGDDGIRLDFECVKCHYEERLLPGTACFERAYSSDDYACPKCGHMAPVALGRLSGDPSNTALKAVRAGVFSTAFTTFFGSGSR